MDSQRSRWDDDRLDELDRKVTEIELQQGRFKRALRNRPTKWQVKQALERRKGPATNTQIIVAAIGAAAIVIAAVIAGYVQLRTSVPMPTR